MSQNVSLMGRMFIDVNADGQFTVLDAVAGLVANAIKGLNLDISGRVK